MGLTLGYRGNLHESVGYLNIPDHPTENGGALGSHRGLSFR